MSALALSVRSSEVAPTIAVKHGERSKWSISASTWISGFELAVACGMPAARHLVDQLTDPGEELRAGRVAVGLAEHAVEGDGLGGLRRASSRR